MATTVTMGTSSGATARARCEVNWTTDNAYRIDSSYRILIIHAMLIPYIDSACQYAMPCHAPHIRTPLTVVVGFDEAEILTPSQEYGPKYGKGDTVGACYHLGLQEIFFT